MLPQAVVRMPLEQNSETTIVTCIYFTSILKLPRTKTLPRASTSYPPTPTVRRLSVVLEDVSQQANCQGPPAVPTNRPQHADDDVRSSQRSPATRQLGRRCSLSMNPTFTCGRCCWMAQSNQSTQYSFHNPHIYSKSTANRVHRAVTSSSSSRSPKTTLSNRQS